MTIRRICYSTVPLRLEKVWNNRKEINMKFILSAHDHHRIPYAGLFLFLGIVIISGCISRGEPRLQAESYLLDYPAPLFKELAVIDDTIRVSRFTIAAAYNNNNMIFIKDNYALDSFNYNRWAVNPADMIGDNLLRDLQESGLFRAAFSRYVVDEGRYNLQGGITEFFLRKDKNGNNAVINLEITLKDSRQREATKRILFQKKYNREELLQEQSPRGYCAAMSLALQSLSRQIIYDIYQTVKMSRADKIPEG
jgi:ABC-type uncharacterized transport system auxiliary subunit